MTNQAVVITRPGVAEVQNVPYPSLPGDDYMIVRTTAVAINPTDWKHVDMSGDDAPIGCHAGCDYAGVVESVGPAVSKPFKRGDRVAGFVNGACIPRKENGAFAKYIAVKSGIQIKVPENLTDEEAATLGVAITTVGQNLYQSLLVPLPNSAEKDARHLLIYGGSTAMGITGIQYAKLSGLTVIATSSPRNFEYLKSLGADYVLDYKSPTLEDDLYKLTKGDLKLAWDCISSQESAKICAKAISIDGGRMAALLRDKRDIVSKTNPKVLLFTPLGYTAFNEPYVAGGVQDPVPEDYEFAKGFWELAEQLLAEGKIKPSRTFVNRGGSGLEGVLVGLQELKDNRVSAGKLVYTL